VDPFPGISHEDLLKLILSMAVLLGAARLLGELARRLSQPAVIGEILAGVLLGPVLLRLAPSLGSWVVPETVVQAQLLDVVAFLGIMLLIVVVGLETDLSLIRSRIRTSATVGLGGLLIPFASGLALGWVFPGDLIGGVSRPIFSLFLAVALALSAIPVLAKVLADLGLLRSRFGQTALAAGMIDDLVGWTLLGLVTALAAEGSLSSRTLASTAGAVALFIAATWFVARPVARASLALVQDRFQLRDRLLSLVVFLALLWGAFSHALHLEPILGAFAIGVIFGQSRRLPVEVVRRLESVTFGVFAPLFLATAGLRIQLDILTTPRLLAITGGLVATAAAGKLIGCYAGGRLAGSSPRESLAFGVALNARGVLGIVVASIGLAMGFFGVEVYSMVVVTSVVTSLAAPVGLRWLLADEIEHETARQSTELESVRRVLLPVRTRPEVLTGLRKLEASIVGALADTTPAMTLMTVVDHRERRAANSYLSRLSTLFPSDAEITRRVVSGDPVTAIVRESQSHDLVILGAPDPDTTGDDHLFEPILDEIIRLLPCSSLILAGREGAWPPRSILVPTGGSTAAARAADLAYALGEPGSRIHLLHVVDQESATQMATGRPSSPAVRLDIGQSIVEDLRGQASQTAASVLTEVVMGPSITTAILQRAEADVDLIVMGANVHAGSHRLYLGPKVEQILREARCSVIVYNV
jgi:Kef-type K+ transport system membrane component KefB/nucleotide-binding universal stress UspA family protein